MRALSVTLDPYPSPLVVLTSFLVGVLALAGSAFFQAHPSPAKPWIQRVRVVGDTVWFEGERAHDSVAVRYCYARRTGAWCRAPRHGPAERPSPRVPQGRADSIALAPGLVLVCRPPVADGGECETFGLRAGDTALHPLVPRASAATLAMLQRAARIEIDPPPTISEFVTAWATSDDAVWFGLGGGFPEGYGAYGGLLRFDRKRGMVETVVHAGLADATVTGLAVDGDTLWVGTIHPAEFGPVGSTGVLCQNLHTGRWTTLDMEGTRLPDKVVQAIAAHDGALFIATRDGLAAFDTRTRQWSVRYFRRATVAGSVGYVLTDQRPSD
jgi:hypothetical protein